MTARRPSAVVAVLFAALVGACTLGPAGIEAEGQVIGLVTAVVGSGPADVERFTLRTDEGRELTFEIRPERLDPASFAPAHLREHLASGEKVAVRWVEEGGRLLAIRLEDA